MTFILLTGAGFTRNWNGWLAAETFEYLLGLPELDEEVRHRLWQSKQHNEGFEDTLAGLQIEHQRQPSIDTERRLRNLESLLTTMFAEMNSALLTQHLLPDIAARFLPKFDYIFTLNQDLLLEHHYLNEAIKTTDTRWIGWQIPGIKILEKQPPSDDPNIVRSAVHTPDPARFAEAADLQPYYKLHGSSNWVGNAGGRLLIMGGNKEEAIEQNPLLRWYHEKFAEKLAVADARLMVIGYSFGDAHINRAIRRATATGLKLFIVDPMGVDVLERAVVIENGLRVNPMALSVIGASRRLLTATFRSDAVEHRKVMRFFSNGL